MSADNGIYVLKTIRTFTQEGNSWKRAEKPYPVWRVAEVGAIDNFDYYKTQQPHNLGAYMLEIWGTSKVFTDQAEALKIAHEMNKREVKGSLSGGRIYHSRTEYGVVEIDTELIFYGDL